MGVVPKSPLPECERLELSEQEVREMLVYLRPQREDRRGLLTDS
jgi:hypothetical protein